MTDLTCSRCGYTRPAIAEGRAFAEYISRNEETNELNKSGDLVCYACLPDELANSLDEVTTASLVTDHRVPPQREDQQGG